MYRLGKFLFDKIPILRPILVKGQMLYAPKFWGMSTLYEPPNISKTDETFNQAFLDLKQFDRTNPHSYDEKTIAGSLWRFWYVSFAARFALLTGNRNLIECGVGMGYTAWFALNETKENFTMHLYDAWNALRKSNQTESEKVGVTYKELDLDTTKKNLKRFEKNTVYHKGYIPESLNDTAPDKISYLHIDLNSSKATKDVLNFFLPRLVNNGIILFDEYGYKEYYETRFVVDQVLDVKKGNLLKLPTGQAIFFRK